MNMHQIVLRQVDKKQPMTMGNMELLLDGTPLEGVTRIVIEADASKEPPRVIMEMVANVKVEGEMNVLEKIIRYV